MLQNLQSSSEAEIDIDKTRVLKTLDLLAKSFAGCPLPANVVQQMLANLKEVEDAVQTYGKSIVNSHEIYDNFWSSWFLFKRMFVELNGDDETPRMVSFFQEQILKAENSVKIAEKTLSGKLRVFSELYELFEDVRASLEETNETGEIQPSMRLVRTLHEFMNSSIRPLFVNATTNRFAYALECVDRVNTSMRGLVATLKVHDQLQMDFDRAERRMRTLFPETLKMKPVETRKEKRDPMPSDKSSSSGTRRKKLRVPRYDDPIYDRLPTRDTSTKFRSVTPPNMRIVRRRNGSSSSSRNPSDSSSYKSSTAPMRNKLALSGVKKIQGTVNSDSSGPSDRRVRRVPQPGIIGIAERLREPISQRGTRLSSEGLKRSKKEVVDERRTSSVTDGENEQSPKKGLAKRYDVDQDAVSPAVRLNDTQITSSHNNSGYRNDSVHRFLRLYDHTPERPDEKRVARTPNMDKPRKNVQEEARFSDSEVEVVRRRRRKLEIERSLQIDRPEWTRSRESSVVSERDGRKGRNRRNEEVVRKREGNEERPRRQSRVNEQRHRRDYAESKGTVEEEPVQERRHRHRAQPEAEAPQRRRREYAESRGTVEEGPVKERRHRDRPLQVEEPQRRRRERGIEEEPMKSRQRRQREMAEEESVNERRHRRQVQEEPVKRREHRHREYPESRGAFEEESVNERRHRCRNQAEQVEEQHVNERQRRHREYEESRGTVEEEPVKRKEHHHREYPESRGRVEEEPMKESRRRRREYPESRGTAQEEPAGERRRRRRTYASSQGTFEEEPMEKRQHLDQSPTKSPALIEEEQIRDEKHEAIEEQWQEQKESQEPFEILERQEQKGQSQGQNESLEPLAGIESQEQKQSREGEQFEVQDQEHESSGVIEYKPSFIQDLQATEEEEPCEDEKQNCQESKDTSSPVEKTKNSESNSICDIPFEPSRTETSTTGETQEIPIQIQDISQKPQELIEETLAIQQENSSQTDTVSPIDDLQSRIEPVNVYPPEEEPPEDTSKPQIAPQLLVSDINMALDEPFIEPPPKPKKEKKRHNLTFQCETLFSIEAQHEEEIHLEMDVSEPVFAQTPEETFVITISEPTGGFHGPTKSPVELSEPVYHTTPSSNEIIQEISKPVHISSLEAEPSPDAERDEPPADLERDEPSPDAEREEGLSSDKNPLFSSEAEAPPVTETKPPALPPLAIPQQLQPPPALIPPPVLSPKPLVPPPLGSSMKLLVPPPLIPSQGAQTARDFPVPPPLSPNTAPDSARQVATDLRSSFRPSGSRDSLASSTRVTFNSNIIVGSGNPFTNNASVRSVTSPQIAP